MMQSFFRCGTTIKRSVYNPFKLSPFGKPPGGGSSYLYHNRVRNTYETSKQSYNKAICYKRNEGNLRRVLKVKQEDYEEATDIEDIQTVVHRLKCSICSMLGLLEIITVVTSAQPEYIIDSRREKREGDLGEKICRMTLEMSSSVLAPSSPYSSYVFYGSHSFVARWWYPLERKTISSIYLPLYEFSFTTLPN